MTPKSKPMTRAEAEGKWDEWKIPVQVKSFTLDDAGRLNGGQTVTIETIGPGDAKLFADALDPNARIWVSLVIETPRAPVKRGRRK